MESLPSEIPSMIEFLTTQGFAGCKLGLETFARDGSWLTKHFSPYVSDFELWEIDSSFESSLRVNFPDAEIRIVDSIREAQSTNKRFDLISIDNPQSIYGHNYCEHFDILPTVHRISKNRCLIFFNINSKPYYKGCSSKEFDLWMDRRKDFYRSNPKELSVDFINSFYKDFFSQQMLLVEEMKLFKVKSKIQGVEDFLYRCAISLNNPHA